MKRTIMFLFPLLGLLALAGCETPTANGSHVPEAAPPKVDVYTVKAEPVPLVRELPGRVAALNVAEVRPQVNGIILKRKFEEGALVAEGQELYEIDASVYRAHFDKATANLRNLERIKDRAKTLRENRTMSEQEYEDALYAWEQGKADIELARLDMEYCKVKAPLSGKIGRSMTTVGALVTSGQPQEMAVIQQIDPVYVDLNPAVPQLLQMQDSSDKMENRHAFWQGATVKLALEDGTKYPLQGKIVFLDNHVRQDTGTVTLRAEFPNPNGVLLPGMFVRATVEEGIRQDGKLIPQQALLRDMKGNPYVWTVDKEDKVSMRKIIVNRTLGNTWLVDSGLETGDRIVVEGIQFIAQDAAVIPTESEMELTKTFE